MMEMVSIVYDWKPALASKSNFCYDEHTICTVSFQHDTQVHPFGGNSRNVKRPSPEFTVGNDFNYQNGSSFIPVVDYLEAGSVCDRFKVQNNVSEFGYLKDNREEITKFMEQMLDQPETDKKFIRMDDEFCIPGLDVRYNSASQVNCRDFCQQEEISFEARDSSDLHQHWWMAKNGREDDGNGDGDDDDDDDARETIESSGKALKEDQFWLVESAFAHAIEEEYNHKLLVHLLIACAEAIARESKDLAAVILTRLHDLVSFTGDTVQRAAYYFTQSFQYFLEGMNDIAIAVEKSSNTLAAFHILYEALPYSKFVHFTANQAILEAIEGESSLHILDFDILEGLQWPPLMEALALRQNPPSLRITAIATDQPGNCLHSSIQDTGRRLSEFAETLGLDFQFQEVCDISPDSTVMMMMMIQEDEAVIMNCMFGLPHMRARSIKCRSAFLEAASTMRPKASDGGEGAHHARIGEHRLHESLQRDSSSPLRHLQLHGGDSQGLARLMVECLVFAPKICEMVGSLMASKETSEEEDEDDEWQTRRSCKLALQKAGFRSMKMSEMNRCQAKLLVEMFKGDRYSIAVDEDEDEEEEEEEKGGGGENEVVLCWDERQIVSVSQWRPLPM